MLRVTVPQSIVPLRYVSHCTQRIPSLCRRTLVTASFASPSATFNPSYSHRLAGSDEWVPRQTVDHRMRSGIIPFNEFGSLDQQFQRLVALLADATQVGAVF